MAEDNKADVSDAHEEYLNAASRVRAMQKQLARAATEEIGVKKVRTLPVAQVQIAATRRSELAQSGLVLLALLVPSSVMAAVVLDELLGGLLEVIF